MKKQSIICLNTLLMFLTITCGAMVSSCADDCDYNHDYCDGSSDPYHSDSRKECKKDKDCKSGYVCGKHNTCVKNRNDF